MTPLDHKDIEHLRDLNLMIAYLKDEVSLEEVEKIEQLMEEDALYRLSMVELSASLTADTTLVKNTTQRLENNMTAVLEKGRDNFIVWLENNDEDPDNDDGGNGGGGISGLPGWVKVSSFIAVITLLTLAVVFSLRQPQLPGNPTEALVVDEEISAAQEFTIECITDGAAVTEDATLESAFLTHFAEGNYAESARQLTLFDDNPFLEPNCQTFVSFYLGQSYIAEKNHKLAAESFEKITSQSEVALNLKHASHWYLGNIYLVNEDYKQAFENFSILAESNQDSENEHLQALMAKNYLSQAKEYLVYLEDKY